MKTLTDEEIERTLKQFEGARAELDENTGYLIGKLLLDDVNYEVNANKESYYKLFKMTGLKTIVPYIIAGIIIKYSHAYT